MCNLITCYNVHPYMINNNMIFLFIVFTVDNMEWRLCRYTCSSCAEIADALPAQFYTVIPCTSPDITIYAFCFMARGATMLNKSWTRTCTYTFWYGWPEEVIRNMMYTPEWAMFTETKWDWFESLSYLHGSEVGLMNSPSADSFFKLCTSFAS